MEDHGLNSMPTKNKDYKIDIGYNADNIAVVKCKLRYVLSLLCVGIMSPWNNCLFYVSVVSISKLNILSIGNILSPGCS